MSGTIDIAAEVLMDCLPMLQSVSRIVGSKAGPAGCVRLVLDSAPEGHNEAIVTRVTGERIRTITVEFRPIDDRLIDRPCCACGEQFEDGHQC